MKDIISSLTFMNMLFYLTGLLSVSEHDIEIKRNSRTAS